MSFAFKIRPAEIALPRLGWVAWLVASLALSCPLSLRSGGLPEPDLVLYGAIRDVSGGGGVRLTAGTLSWTFGPSGTGTPIAVAVVLTNINDQFSYVARVPCETPIAGFPGTEGTLSLGSTYDRSQVSVDDHPATLVQPAQALLTLAATDRGRIERVDLEVSIGGSGLLPDNWQQQYFGHTGVDPYADADADGLDNLGEYLAGTNPVDPNSVFAIEIAEPAAGEVTVSWASVAGFVYTVQRSRDLLTGFQDVAVDIVATPPRNSYLDPDALDQGPYFYRLTVRPAIP